MFILKNVEELLDMLLVCEDPDNISASEVQAAYKTLRLAKAELIYYIRQLMGDEEQYLFELMMPSDAVSIVNVDFSKADFKMVYMPFLTVSDNLWQRLKAEPNNPVFQVLRYFSDSVKAIRGILRMYNVPDEIILTKELLNKAHIFDMFSLHDYESIYVNVEECLSNDR